MINIINILKTYNKNIFNILTKLTICDQLIYTLKIKNCKFNIKNIWSIHNQLKVIKI